MTPTAKTPTAMTQEACLTAPPPAASADSDSSLTGAYLNQFTEMVKLIEQLPDTPELIGDLLNWHPKIAHRFSKALKKCGSRSRPCV
jgi:hypothetical protein